MKRKLVLFCALALVFYGLPVQAAEKLKFATAVKESAEYYLRVLAAEEKKLWEQNGLQVEWVPFKGAGEMFRSVAAGAIFTGFAATSSIVEAQVRGVPAITVSDVVPYDPFVIWVRTDSRFKEPRDYKGARVGVARFGGAQHLYGQLIAKALGVEKDVKFVSIGGIPEGWAALKTGIIDAMVQPLRIMVKMKLAGEVKEFLRAADYLPKEWTGHALFTSKDFARTSPDIVARVVKTVLQASDFIQKDPRWAIDKMKEVSGYSEEAAKLIYEKDLSFSKDGRLSRRALENVVNFLVEYGVIAKDKAPRLEELFTTQFTG